MQAHICTQGRMLQTSGNTCTLWLHMAHIYTVPSASSLFLSGLSPLLWCLTVPSPKSPSISALTCSCRAGAQRGSTKLWQPRPGHCSRASWHTENSVQPRGRRVAAPGVCLSLCGSNFYHSLRSPGLSEALTVRHLSGAPTVGGKGYIPGV